MLVKDLLEADTVTVLPADTLSDAWLVMNEAGIIGACVVTENGELVGFVTDGDLVRACMPSEVDITIYDDIMEKMDLPAGFLKNLRSMRTEQVMQDISQLIVIDQSDPVLKALALMFQHRLRRIPVLDGHRLVGTISRGTILTDLLVKRVLDQA